MVVVVATVVLCAEGVRCAHALIRHGLMPESREERKGLEIKGPYAMRARGVREGIEPCELGRALFYIDQRLGFRSDLRVDARDDDNRQATRTAIKRLQEHLQEEDFPAPGSVPP